MDVYEGIVSLLLVDDITRAQCIRTWKEVEEGEACMRGEEVRALPSSLSLKGKREGRDGVT